MQCEGVFTRRDLAGEGWSEWESRRLCAQAQSIRHGVYDEEGAVGWERYRLHCSAVLDALSPHAALSGPSAAAFWKLPFISEVPTRVFVRDVPRGGYADDVAVISGGKARTTRVDGSVCTDPAWTVADCARTLGAMSGLVMADAATHARPCGVPDLEHVASQLARCRGVGRVRWVAEQCDRASESPGESWMRVLVRSLGYNVRSQVEIRDAGEFVARVDLMIEGTRVILEFDGSVKYTDGDARTVANEKRRQARLESLGYVVLRVLWEQLRDPATLARRIEVALKGHLLL